MFQCNTTTEVESHGSVRTNYGTHSETPQQITLVQATRDEHLPQNALYCPVITIGLFDKYRVWVDYSILGIR